MEQDPAPCEGRTERWELTHHSEPLLSRLSLVCGCSLQDVGQAPALNIP